jgi:hypothetical protein
VNHALAAVVIVLAAWIYVERETVAALIDAAIESFYAWLERE